MNPRQKRMKMSKIQIKTVHTLSDLSKALGVPWDASHQLKITDSISVGLAFDTFFVAEDGNWATAEEVAPHKIVEHAHAILKEEGLK